MLEHPIPEPNCVSGGGYFAGRTQIAPRFGRWLEGFHWWESGRRVRLSLLNLFQPGFDWPWWFAECGPLQPPESIRLEKRFQLLGGRARLARLLAHSFLRTVALAVVRHEPLDKTSSTQRSVEDCQVVRMAVDVAVVAKSEVLVALPAWLVGGLGLRSDRVRIRR